MTEMTTDIEDWVFILGEVITNELGFYSDDHDLRTKGIMLSSKYDGNEPIKALEFRLHELVHLYSCENRNIQVDTPRNHGVTTHLQYEHRATNHWEAIVTAVVLRVGSVLLRHRADFEVFGKEALRGIEVSLNATRKKWQRHEALSHIARHLNHQATLALTEEVINDIAQHIPVDNDRLMDRLPALTVTMTGRCNRFPVSINDKRCLRPGPLE